MGAVKICSIKSLVESKPLGLTLSVNEIKDFRNYEKIHKNFNINSFFIIRNFISNQIVIIDFFQIIDMVPGIFNFVNRPN